MSHAFPLQPPPPTGDPGQDRWNRELFRLLRLYMNALYAPGCGIRVENDVLRADLDDTSLECTSSGIQIKWPDGVSNYDLFYYLNGALERVPIGDDGQVLTIVDGVPAWATDRDAGAFDFSDPDSSHHLGAVA